MAKQIIYNNHMNKKPTANSNENNVNQSILLSLLLLLFLVHEQHYTRHKFMLDRAKH